MRSKQEPLTENWHFVEVGADDLAKTSTLTSARISDGELVLKRNGEIVRSRPWPTATEELCVSANNLWIWHLGWDEGCIVSLLDAESLEVIDTYRPTEMYDYLTGQLDPSELPVLLPDWGELVNVVSVHEAPDMLVICGNCGDSFTYLQALEASSTGIRDRVGRGLYEVVFSHLDQVIYGARFLSTDRIAIVDDIGNLLVFRWPSLALEAQVSIREFLEDEDGFVRVFSDHEPLDTPYVGSELASFGDQLLLSIVNSDSGKNEAILCLRLDNLEPTGLARSPTQWIDDLKRIGQWHFCLETDEAPRYFEMRRM